MRNKIFNKITTSIICLLFVCMSGFVHPSIAASGKVKKAELYLQKARDKEGAFQANLNEAIVRMNR